MIRALVAALALSGCVNVALPFDAELCVSDHITPGRVEALGIAIESWRFSTHGTVDLSQRITDDPSACAYSVQPWRFRGHTTLGGTLRTPDQIKILVDQGEDLTLGGPLAVEFFVHEIGHALGLEHAREGVMQPVTAGEFGGCIDAGTLDAFCETRGCPLGVTDTCEGVIR